MATKQGIRYQPFQPHGSKPRLKADGLSQPSFQLPNLPDDIMPYHQPFPPPPPSELIIRAESADKVQSLDRRWTWGRDSLYDPRDLESVWFSCAELYAKIQASSGSDELELSQTHPIIKFWFSLRDAQYAGEMDAFLPHPNMKDEMYVFAGILTARIDTTSKTVDSEGLREITDRWPSLKTVGFTRVDTILLDPGNLNRAWFFNGRQFVGIGWEPGVVNDYVIDGPKPITEGWRSLKAAGFEYVATFVQNAQSPDQPWVFSGNKYMRISISADSILFGPAPIPDQDSEN